MGAKFLQGIYLRYFVILELAGSYLLQTMLNPPKSESIGYFYLIFFKWCNTESFHNNN